MLCWQLSQLTLSPIVGKIRINNLTNAKRVHECFSDSIYPILSWPSSSLVTRAHRSCCCCKLGMQLLLRVSSSTKEAEKRDPRNEIATHVGCNGGILFTLPDFKPRGTRYKCANYGISNYYSESAHQAGFTKFQSLVLIGSIFSKIQLFKKVNIPNLQRNVWSSHLGPVVQKPINAYPRLKINQGVYFSTPTCTLFNADIRQSFALEEVNLEKQK